VHYEVWGHQAGNLIAATQTEQEALSVVRDLLAAGWDADDLSVGLEPDEDADAENLPAVMQGAALRDWALGSA
jgi:hypothetical protein